MILNEPESVVFRIKIDDETKDIIQKNLQEIDYAERKGIPLDNMENLSYLMEQVISFMRRVLPPNLQHRKRTPEDATEPQKIKKLVGLSYKQLSIQKIEMVFYN